MSNENSNLRVGSAGAGLFVGSTEILGGGVTVSYEDGFFNDAGSACIIINNSQETKSFSIGGRKVNVLPNSIEALYNYGGWEISTENDIVYDFRFGDADNGGANELIQGKAGEELFSLSSYGSYLIIKIIS